MARKPPHMLPCQEEGLQRTEWDGGPLSPRFPCGSEDPFQGQCWGPLRPPPLGRSPPSSGDWRNWSGRLVTSQENPENSTESFFDRLFTWAGFSEVELKIGNMSRTFEMQESQKLYDGAHGSALRRRPGQAS